MDQRSHISARDVGAWQQSPGAVPRTVDGVRCGSCGAHTPVLGVDPACLYCSMPVDLPNDVAARAREVQRNLERAREEAKQFDREFASDAAGYITLILVLQLVGLLVALGLWFDVLARTSQTPTGLQGLLVSCSFLGPLLFWGVTQHLRLDADLRDYAKRSFARLEVQPHATGQQLLLSCSGCGGALDSTKIQGLSIRCTHCDNAMLAPACLVDEGQRRFLQKVLALRARLERKSYTREIVLCVAGVAYIGTFAWSVRLLGGMTSAMTNYPSIWVLLMFLYSFFLVFFWFVTHKAEGLDFLGAASAVIAFPAVVVAALVLMYLEVLGVKTILH
jgi:hypothetical protein